MCLAIPAKVVSIDETLNRMADGRHHRRVSQGAVSTSSPRRTSGDHVLVHAGFAIQVVDEAYAAETLELLKTLDPISEDLDGIDPLSSRRQGSAHTRRIRRGDRHPPTSRKELPWTQPPPHSATPDSPASSSRRSSGPRRSP